jgi:hypothetical protein
MNLPLFMCQVRSIGSEFYMDGGLTNNAPVLNAYTVRVSPTDETAHIRPEVAPTLLQFTNSWKYCIHGAYVPTGVQQC